ncbi:unnamed protein product [Amoebophrya sp. A25]|nr:unnamed protein product [Amoebophrya sp. A25]|eukprot:GSA25T00004949001.1
MKGSAPSSPVLAAAAGDRVALGLASGVKFGKAPKGDKAKGGAALLQPSEGDKSGVLSKKGKIKGDKSGKYGKSKGPAQPQADARSAPITPRGAPSFVEESATVDDLVGTQGTTPLAPDEELRYAGLTLGDDRQMEQMLDLPFVSDDRNIKDGIPLIEQGGSSSSTAGQALEQQQLPSAYDDVTLIDQPYETPALSELEDTPAERVDQQMLALLRRLEKLPQPQDASKTSSWDELVCVTLVDVLQILPQEAVALLLKPSSSVPAGQPPGTDGVYRTLLYDVVLEAECPSTDMIVQPMQSLGMGLRLWLCDLLKLSAHIHLTEADFAPFCLFFGQLLTTGCADLALQLFHKILVSEKTTITRKAQADVFAWLVQTRALTDLVVLLRGAKPGSRDDPFLQAGPGGATSSADPLRGEYGSTHPAPAGGAGPLVEAEGRSERVSSPSRMLRGEDDSSPVRQEGGGDSSGCAKPFTGEQADRDDPDASGAGGDAASAPKLRQNASSKRLVGALSAYEDAVRKEFGSTSGRRAGYGYSGGTRTPTDIPLESIVDFLYFCSRDAQVDFLSRFLPEVAEPELLYKYGRQALRRTDAVESIYWQGALGPLLQITLADDDMHGLCFAAELVLCYHDRPLSPMSVDDACTSVLEKLRAFALELPATEDTYRAWSCLFFLVERFFEGQILRFTSAAYRTICCAFMERGMLFHNRADKESPKTDGIRTFALKLLIRFLAHPDVPVGVLAELLLKQLELLQTLSIADLDLIMALSGHERLGVTYGRRFLEVLGQACFQNPYFARAASIPFLKLVARFAAEDGIYEFMEGLTKIGLSYILKEPLKWRNALVVDLLTKVGNLHERVSEAVKKPVVEAAITYLQTFKGLVLQQSLRLILEVWPEELRTLQDTFYNMNYEEEDAEKAGGAASNGASLGDGQSPNHPTHIPLTHLQPKGVDEPIVNFNANPLLEGVELGKGEMS